MPVTQFDPPTAVAQQPPGRLLMVSNFLSPSGTSRGACEELADRLSGAGWQVITTSDKMQKLRRLADMLSTAWRRRDEYDVAQIDVFSGSAFLWAEAVSKLLRWINKPYVLTLHGGGLPEFAASRKQRVAKLLGSASAVTTPSDFLLREMASYRKGMKLIPNAVDLSRYEYRCRTHTGPQLVWLRSLHKIYNPVMAIEVLADLKKDYPDVHLTMVGPDKDGSKARVQAAAEALGVTAQLTLTGVVAKPDVPQYLQNADIFLNTANFDNTPISLIEAMACGLCVVTTNVGGVPDLASDEHDALLTPPGEAKPMANAVRRILRQPVLAGQLSSAACETVDRFDWSATLPQWERILHQVLLESQVHADSIAAGAR